MLKSIFEKRKSPNQGTYMGFGIAHPTGTMRHNRQNERSANERAMGGRGPPPRLFASGLSLGESLDPPPGTRAGTTSQVWTCAGPNPDHLPTAEKARPALPVSPPPS